MKGILADANAIGPIEALVHQMQTGVWAEFWTALGLAFKRFEDVGLSQDSSDLAIMGTTCIGVYSKQIYRRPMPKAALGAPLSTGGGVTISTKENSPRRGLAWP